MKNCGRHGMTLKFNKRRNLIIKFLILWCATPLSIKSFSGSIIHSSVPPKNHFAINYFYRMKNFKENTKMMQMFFFNSRTSITFPFKTLSNSIHTLGIGKGWKFLLEQLSISKSMIEIWEFNTKSKSHLGMSQNLRLMNLIQRFSQWNAVFCTRQNFTFPVIDYIGTFFFKVLLKWCFFV